jgi:hypothetical protein
MSYLIQIIPSQVTSLERLTLLKGLSNCTINRVNGQVRSYQFIIKDEDIKPTVLALKEIYNTKDKWCDIIIRRPQGKEWPKLSIEEIKRLAE